MRGLVGEDGAEGGVRQAAQHQDGRHGPSLTQIHLREHKYEYKYE